MELIHCQKDYFENTITVLYDGEYDKQEAIEYVKKHYDNVIGEIIEVQEPSEFKGLKNDGVVTLR